MRMSIVILLVFCIRFSTSTSVLRESKDQRVSSPQKRRAPTIQHRRGCDEPWRNRGGFHISLGSGLLALEPEQEPP